MVLESLLNPFVIKKKPWEMFFAGVFFSLISLILSFLVFKEGAGMLTIFLIVLSTVPILYTTIKNEEELDLKYDQEFFLLKEHTKVLFFLMFLFLGITLALTIAYVFLPNSMINSVFNIQQQAILNVTKNIQATLTGNVIKFDLFLSILINNLKVLFFCLIFSLLYGTGAMFILAWNASVIATAMGNLIKTQLMQTATSVGILSISHYFGAVTFSFIRYMTHGLLEIAAYFVAGMAGGIISIALIKHDLKKDRVLIDSLDLILISIGLILVAGIVEVYITPIFYV